MRGFENFLMQGRPDRDRGGSGRGDRVTLSTLIKVFTDNIITPLVNRAGGGGTTGLGVHVKRQLINFGAFISAVIDSARVDIGNNATLAGSAETWSPVLRESPGGDARAWVPLSASSRLNGDLRVGRTAPLAPLR